MPTLSPQQLNLVQYTHLEKIYGYFPNVSEATLASLFGLDEARYRAARAEFDARAREAAQELLADSGFAKEVERLPFATGGTVLAVGDSLTDDLQSWFEILRHLLLETRPHGDHKFVNFGLSAHTSAMVLRRFVSMLTPNPDWIFCLLGGNDVTRVGAETNKPQVSLTETEKNLRTLRRLAAERTNADWVWVTPPPFDEARSNSFPPFKLGGAVWRNADLRAVGDFMRRQPERVIDTWRVFGVPPTAELQGPDGVHPPLAGQQAIARAVVTQFTAQLR